MVCRRVDVRYEVTNCHSSDLLSDQGMSSSVYMVATVPPDRVPFTLKKDWDFVIVKSGCDAWRVRKAE